MQRLLIAFILTLSLGKALAQAPSTNLPPIKTASYDAAGRFLVNGEPFFPILLYGAPTDEASLTKLRDFHFNVLTCRPQDCDGLPARGFYGAVHVGKKFDQGTSGVLLTMGIDSPALYYKKDLLAQTAEANGKITSLVPNRPIMNAIGYWEDEPEGVFTGKLPSRAVYEDLVAALDISAPYLYPVPYQPVASVGEAVSRARLATKGSKPLLPILQLFAWKATDRYPTPAELRCMAFLALVEGAQGIGYYSYGSVTGKPKTTIAEAQPELWKSVRNLNRELAVYGPRLLAGTATELKIEKLPDAIKIKSIRDNDGHLTILVNTSPESHDVALLSGSMLIKLPALGVEILKSTRP